MTVVTPEFRNISCVHIGAHVRGGFYEMCCHRVIRHRESERLEKLLRNNDEIKRPFASKEISNDGEQVSDVFSVCKDNKLISVFQINQQNF